VGESKQKKRDDMTHRRLRVLVSIPSWAGADAQLVTSPLFARRACQEGRTLVS
jgi:hypothetical protein